MVSHQELHRATRSAAVFYRQQFRDRPRGWAAQHLRDRGVREATLSGETGWWLGYAPDTWTGLVDRLRREKIDDETLVAAGLATVTRDGYLIDRFRGRVMFVAEDQRLNPVGFIGRAPGGPVRYLNTPMTEIYNKSKTLVGIGAQRHRLVKGALPVVVEGTMDALAVSDAGERWAGVAACGTAISRDQALMLRRMARSDAVVVAFDGNRAGRYGAARNLEVLSEVFGVVLAADLPEGHDPSSLFTADPARLRQVLGQTRPLTQFAIDVELSKWDKVLDHLSGQVNAIRAVAPLVARLPSGRVAGEIARLSQKVGIEEHVVSREVLAAVGSPKTQRTPRRGTNRRVANFAAGADPPEVSRTP